MGCCLSIPVHVLAAVLLLAVSGVFHVHPKNLLLLTHMAVFVLLLTSDEV